MSVITVSAVCIIVAAISTVFKRYNKEYSLFITVLMSAVILFAALRTLVPVVDELQKAVSSHSAVNEYLTLMLKGLGICYIGSFAAGVCTDSGDKSLADEVELVAKISIAVLYLPVLLDLLGLATDMIRAG